MQEILMKYTCIRCTYYPWLLTSGIKIVFLIIGSLILNKVIVPLSKKQVVSLMEFLLRCRRKNTNPNFTTSSKIAILIITSLMVLEVFSRDRSNPSSSRNCGLGIWFWRSISYPRYYFWSFIILENQYRIGDVVKFDNAGGTVEEISLRKTTLRDLDGTVHHIPHGEIKYQFSKDFSY
jgi:small conductance mechanosensitive channel